MHFCNNQLETYRSFFIIDFLSFSLVLRGQERIKKRHKPGSFYTVEPDSWSPVWGKSAGRLQTIFPAQTRRYWNAVAINNNSVVICTVIDPPRLVNMCGVSKKECVLILMSIHMCVSVKLCCQPMYVIIRQYV